MFIGVRGFRCHWHIFVVLGVESRDSCFQVPSRTFVVSGAKLRAFGCEHSWFQVLNFVLSGTEHQKFFRRGSGLWRSIPNVTLLNTDSNTH